MRNEVMASFLLAGVLLLLGAGGYITVSELSANETAQNATANVSLTVINTTNESANISLVQDISANLTDVNQTTLNITNVTDITNITANTTANVTATSNVTYVYNTSGTSSGGGSGGGSGGRNRRPVTTTGANESGGLLHYGDCLAVSNGKVCLEDVAVGSNEAILSVYNSSNGKVSTIMVGPITNCPACIDKEVSLDNGKAISVKVYETAINGTDIQAIVYISNSNKESNEVLLDGRMYPGDCIEFDFSKVCLADISDSEPYYGSFQVYDPHDRMIHDEGIGPGSPGTTLVIGNGKSVLIQVSQVIHSNTSEWLTASIKEVNSTYMSMLLFCGEYMPTFHSFVYLEDVAVASPHEAIFRVVNRDDERDSTNIMVKPGSYETAEIDDGDKEVTVYVQKTVVNGSLCWALVSTADTDVTSRTATAQINFDECVDAGFAKACLADIAMDEPHAAILKVYDGDGNFVSNVMIAPGSSKTIRITNSSSAAISVIRTYGFLNMDALFGAVVSISRG